MANVSHDFGRSGSVSLPQAVGADWSASLFEARRSIQWKVVE
jgi:hypothetical protein